MVRKDKKSHLENRWLYKKFGWAAYPSYQVPFRERRVPFLLVKFHYIIAEKEMFFNKNHFI